MSLGAKAGLKSQGKTLNINNLFIRTLLSAPICAPINFFKPYDDNSLIIMINDLKHILRFGSVLQIQTEE